MFQLYFYVAGALAAHLKESALGSVKTTSGMENAGQNAMFQSEW